MNRTCRVSLVLASTLGLSAWGACNRPQQPPTLPVPKTAPVAVPVPKAPADDSLFAYLRIRDPGRIAKALLGERAERAAQQQGLSLAELSPGKNAAVFLWDPGTQGFSAPPVAALLPVPPQGTLATRLAHAAGSEMVRPFGEATLSAMNPFGMARATAAGAALNQLTDEPQGSDAQLYVHVAAILARYGDQLRGGLNSALTAGAGSAGAAPSPQAALGMLGGYLDRLAAIKSLTLSLALLPQDLEIGTVVEDRAAAKDAGPFAVPDLTGLLPADDIRFQWNVRDLRRSLDQLWALYLPMLQERPAVRDQVRGLFDELARVCPQMQSAVAISLNPQSGVHAFGVTRPTDAQGLLEFARRAAGAISKGPLHDLYKDLFKQGGRAELSLQVQLQPAVRKLKGWPVDRYQYHLSASGPTPPESKALIEKLNRANYEVMRLGPYVIFALNAPIDGLVTQVLEGKASRPLRAHSAYPPGGFYYGDVDIAGFWSGVKALLPPTEAARLPSLPGPVGVMTFSGFEGPAATYYRAQLPRALLALLGVSPQ